MLKFTFPFLLIFFVNFSIFAKSACVDKILESPLIEKIDTNVSNKVDQANLFFDTSLNMVGFINSPSSSYKLFLSELIKKTPLFSENQTFQTYFANINTIDVTDIGGVTTNEKFYQCPSEIPLSDCHKIKTQLSSVLTAVDLQSKDSVSIIVTDLFLGVDELLTKKNRDKIAKPLAKALNRGDAIGIFGIQSSYEGKIFGICTNNTQTKRTTYDGATSRPFFVILVGDKNVILNFKELMDEQVIPVIGAEKVEFNLFTNDIIKSPYYAAEWPTTSFKIGNGVTRGKVLENERKDIIEFVIDKNHDPLGISVDLSKIKTPYTLPLSDFHAETQTYMQINDSGSCTEQWMDLGSSSNVTFFEQENDGTVLFNILDSKNQDRLQFQRNFNYIFQIDFRAKKIAESKNKLWMEEPGWTFSCEQSDQITDPESGRSKFPVLNLDTFSDLLKQIQKENFKETSISQLNTVVHLSK